MIFLMWLKFNVKKEHLEILFIPLFFLFFKFFLKFFAVLILIMLAIFFLCLLGSLLKRILDIFPKIRILILRNFWRWVVNTRKFYEISLLTEFFLLISILSFFVFVLCLFFLKNKELYDFFLHASMLLMGISAFIDLNNKISKLIYRAWAKSLGKLIMVAVGPIVYFISTAMVKLWIIKITHSDPKFFSEFANLASIVYSLSIYIFLIILVFNIIVMFEWVCITLPMSIYPVLNIFSPGILSRLFYRLSTGKKIGKGMKISISNFRIMVIFFRVISPLALIAILYMTLDTIKLDDKLESLLLNIFVGMHYHLNYECSNLPHLTSLVKLDGNTVSIVTEMPDKRFVFSKSICKTGNSMHLIN